MELYRLGRSELHVSPVILGAWAFGSWQWGDQPEDSVHIATIHAALEVGINTIDTAAAYGRSEEIVGKALKGRRDEVVILTKCSGDRASMRQQVENSLQKLGTDCIDLCYIHGPNRNISAAENIGYLDEMRGEGKLRYMGISNFSATDHAEVLAAARIDATQPCYGILWRSIEHDGLRQWCLDNEVSITPFSPIAQGLISGKYGVGSPLPTDYRSRNLLFQPGRFEKSLEVCSLLKDVAGSYGKTVTQVAINWCIHAPWGMTLPIVGARSPEQAVENTGAAGWSLAPEDWAAISDAGESALEGIDYRFNIWGDSATWGKE